MTQMKMQISIRRLSVAEFTVEVFIAQPSFLVPPFYAFYEETEAPCEQEKPDYYGAVEPGVHPDKRRHDAAGQERPHNPFCPFSFRWRGGTYRSGRLRLFVRNPKPRFDAATFYGVVDCSIQLGRVGIERNGVGIGIGRRAATMHPELRAGIDVCPAFGIQPEAANRRLMDVIRIRFEATAFGSEPLFRRRKALLAVGGKDVQGRGGEQTSDVGYDPPIDIGAQFPVVGTFVDGAVRRRKDERGAAKVWLICHRARKVAQPIEPSPKKNRWAGRV